MALVLQTPDGARIGEVTRNSFRRVISPGTRNFPAGTDWILDPVVLRCDDVSGMNRFTPPVLPIAARSRGRGLRRFGGGPTITLLGGLCFLLALLPGRAASKEWSRPGAESGPTVIRMHVFVIDVDEINGADQTFTANVYFEASWDDPRLAEAGALDRSYGLEEIWHPEILLVNQQKIWPTMLDSLRVSPEGTVTYRQQVWGNFSQPLDLHEFPFDQQEFTLQFACPDLLGDEIRFEAAPGDESGIAEKLSLPDWQIEGWELGPEAYEPIAGAPGRAGFAFTFTAARESNYYVIKVIVPLLLILVMASVVFWINPAEGGTQIGVSTTAMLTLIAYRFAIGSDLPKIPYLTRMDVFILAATILVAVCLVEVVATSRLASSGRIKTALHLDQVMRVLFPLTLVLVGAYAFYLF